MKVLLAIDGLACSDVAIEAVISQFRPDETDVRVPHVVEWPAEMPGSLALTPGAAAAGAIMDLCEEGFPGGSVADNGLYVRYVLTSNRNASDLFAGKWVAGPRNN